MDEAVSLQRTTSMYVFGNTAGQPYTVSGFNTILRRLMIHCVAKAEAEGIEFTLSDMLPAAMTDRMDEGDSQITNATGHNRREWSSRSTIAARPRPPGQQSRSLSSEKLRWPWTFDLVIIMTRRNK